MPQIVSHNKSRASETVSVSTMSISRSIGTALDVELQFKPPQRASSFTQTAAVQPMVVNASSQVEQILEKRYKSDFSESESEATSVISIVPDVPDAKIVHKTAPELHAAIARVKALEATEAETDSVESDSVLGRDRSVEKQGFYHLVYSAT